MRCNGDINSVLDLLVLKCCGALKKKNVYEAVGTGLRCRREIELEV